MTVANKSFKHYHTYSDMIKTCLSLRVATPTSWMIVPSHMYKWLLKYIDLLGLWETLSLNMDNFPPSIREHITLSVKLLYEDHKSEVIKFRAAVICSPELLDSYTWLEKGVMVNKYLNHKKHFCPCKTEITYWQEHFFSRSPSLSPNKNKKAADSLK